MTPKARCALLATSVACLLGASTASANGRFPRAEHLIEDPADANRLIIAATYGVLMTNDGGANWYYSCEEAFSFIPASQNGGYSGDPVMALMPDGSLLAGVGERVTLSPDRGCQWRTLLDVAPQANIEDLAIAPSNRTNVVALVKAVSPEGGLVMQLRHSGDGGLTWRTVGAPLPIVIGYTLDVDPKDPMHIYVTGVASAAEDVETGVLLSSPDLGTTWTSRPIPKTNIVAPPFIAAVHPNDGNKIFVRTDEWTDTTNAYDALWYTANAGQTWTELLRPNTPAAPPELPLGAKLFSFALSPDGSTVLAGFGDPVEGGGRLVDTGIMGIYRSTGADYSFGANPKPIYVDSISCLQWTAKGIYFCGAPDGGVSYLGFAKDLSSLTPAAATIIMRASDVRGEPLCCNGRSVTSCDWNGDCGRLKACTADAGGSSAADAAACAVPDAGPDVARPDDSGTGDAGAGGATGDGGGTGGRGGVTDGGTADSGTGGAAIDGGSGGRGGSAGGSGGSSGGSAGSGATPPSDGCDCRLSMRPGSRGGHAFALLLFAWATRRRRCAPGVKPS